MPRIVGIDYGRVRVGIALSDERKILAQPLMRLELDKAFFSKLKSELAKKGPVEKAVVGLPLQMNGKEGEMAAEVRRFGQALEKELGIPVLFWDERLTTAQVERSLKEAEMSRKKRAEKNDALSAVVILQSYLDSL